jgi:hypothetical protein
MRLVSKQSIQDQRVSGYDAGVANWVGINCRAGSLARSVAQSSFSAFSAELVGYERGLSTISLTNQNGIYYDEAL